MLVPTRVVFLPNLLLPKSLLKVVGSKWRGHVFRDTAHSGRLNGLQQNCKEHNWQMIRIQKLSWILHLTLHQSAVFFNFLADFSGTLIFLAALQKFWHQGPPELFLQIQEINPANGSSSSLFYSLDQAAEYFLDSQYPRQCALEHKKTVLFHCMP